MITIPGKIPIRIHPFFWILIFGIGWLNSATFLGSLVWGIVIFVSVLIHEFGHALTALAFGQSAQIDLVPMGGVTSRSGRVLKLWQEFIVVLNGPLAGFSLFILAALVNVITPEKTLLMAYILSASLTVNLIWTLLNLLPIQPLDGGKLLSIVMESIFGLKGVKIALFISAALACIFGLLAFYYNQLFVGALFFIFMYESYRNWQSSLALSENDKDSNLLSLFKVAEEDYHQKHTEEAIGKFQQVRNLAGNGLLYNASTAFLADIYAEKGRYQESYDLLAPLSKKLDAQTLRLFQHVAFRLGKWKETVEIGKRAYQLNPHYEIAYLNAIACSMLGDKSPAIGWLKCAIREGLPDAEKALAIHEFDSIRQEPEFQEILNYRKSH